MGITVYRPDIVLSPWNYGVGKLIGPILVHKNNLHVFVQILPEPKDLQYCKSML